MSLGNRHHFSTRRGEHGFTMLEILVTLFIITAWLLATAGVQSSAAKLNKAAQVRTQAVILASELAERIEANKQEAAKGTYACDPCSTTTTSTACVGEACGAEELATFDKAERGKRVGDMLPGATATIAWNAAATPPAYTITLGWTDRRSSATYGQTGTAESSSYTSTKTVFFDPG